MACVYTLYLDLHSILVLYFKKWTNYALKHTQLALRHWLQEHMIICDY